MSYIIYHLSTVYLIIIQHGCYECHFEGIPRGTVDDSARYRLQDTSCVIKSIPFQNVHVLVVPDGCTGWGAAQMGRRCMVKSLQWDMGWLISINLDSYYSVRKSDAF